MSLWGITTYFDLLGTGLRLPRFQRFLDRIHDQLPLIIVECAFNDHPFQVGGDLQLRTQSVLWQKERLLNEGLKLLPKDCDRVAWLDSDIEFEDSNWAEETSRLLDRFPVVQPWSTCEGLRSVAAIQAGVKDPDVIAGHPGYAWAARREVLEEEGFYDRAIVGGGSGIMAWAMYGYAGPWPGRRRAANYFSAAQLVDIEEWSKGFHDQVHGSVGVREGRVLHHEHSDPDRRLYMERMRILKRHGFDPEKDLVLKDKAWEWTGNKPELEQEVNSYFDFRETP